MSAAHGAKRLAHTIVVQGRRVNVTFRWCAGCRTWLRVEGIAGILRWAREHGAHAQSSSR